MSSEPNPNQIVINFVGICTHLWEEQSVPFNPAWGTRIVLPAAADPLKVAAISELLSLDPPISPHVATLAIPVANFVSQAGRELIFLPWDGSQGNVIFTILDGVTITIANPVTSQGLTKNARCMPGLGSFLPGVAPGNAATSSDKHDAAAYFDFTSGSLTGTQLTAGAGSIVYQQDTDPTVSGLQITITPFDTNLDPTTITLQGENGAELFINNIPFLPEDNDNDFVLHYLVANVFPTAWPPVSPTLEPPCAPHPNGPAIAKLIKQILDIGAGCSNSNIP